MKKNGHFGEMLVGLFVAGVFVLLAFFTIVISGAGLLSGGGQRLDVSFSSVGGLRPHDSVIVRGVPVGQVKKMWLSDGGVQVELTLKEKVQMREGYRISVVSSSLLGGHDLLIEEGHGALLSPKTLLIGESPHDLVREVTDVVSTLKSTLSDDGMLGNLRKSSESLVGIMSRLERGEGTLGKLLSSDDSIYTNLATTVVNLTDISGRLNRGEGTLGRLLSSDDQVYKDISGTAANLKDISGRLNRGEGMLGRLLAADDPLYRDVAASAANLRAVTDRIEKGEGTLGRLLSKDDQIYRDVSATLASLREVSDRLEKGEGTLGKLSKDDALYKDLKGLVGDARQTLDGFRETTPVTTFTSILFGAL